MSALRQLSNSPRSSQARPGKGDRSIDRRRRVAAARPVRQQAQAHRYRLLMAESIGKIAVSVAVCSVSIATLANIVPARMGQQEKLQELQSEVTMTEERVAKLKTEFSRSFDPAQVSAIAQEQTHFADPNRTPVVWIDKKGAVSATLPDQ
jgi:cell division protein FtsB